MNHFEVSEIVTGMVLRGKMNPLDVPLNLLDPDFVPIVEGKQNALSDAELATKSYTKMMDLSIKASERVVTDLDWLGILQRTAVYGGVADIMTRELRKLERGIEPDLVAMTQAVTMVEDLELADDTGFVPMSEITEQGLTLLPSHYAPIDVHVGGLPESAVTIIGGKPGTGKTFLLAKILISRLRAEKEEKAAIVTLEMTRAQIRDRAIATERLPKTIQSRLLVHDASLNVNELVAKLHRLKKQNPTLKFVGVDYVDYLPEKMPDAAEMEYIWRKLSIVAKDLDLVLIVCAQLNTSYMGGVPVVTDLRWSRMAEAFAATILFTYNPANTIVREMGKGGWKALPTFKGFGYLVSAKTKFQSPHANDLYSGVGAIRIKFRDRNVVWSDDTDETDDWYAYEDYGMGGEE